MRSSVPIWCSGFLCLLGLWSAHGQGGAQPFKFYETPLPYCVAWGPYTVSVAATGEDKKVAYRLRIADRAGRVLREIDAEDIGTVDFPNLDGSGFGQLRVATTPGNNILAGCRTYCFTCRGKLHNVLVMPFEFDQLRNLDHADRPELLSDNPAPLEYVGDLCHACSPLVYLILRWNGARYELANRWFPAVVLAEVAEKKKRFLADLGRFNNPQSEPLSWGYIVGDATGIWADMASIGRQHEARRWLLARLPSEFVRREFLETLTAAQKRLAKLPVQVRTDQSRIIHAPTYRDD